MPVIVFLLSRLMNGFACVPSSTGANNFKKKERERKFGGTQHLCDNFSLVPSGNIFH